MQFSKTKKFSIRFTPDQMMTINNVSEELDVSKTELLRTFIDEGLKVRLQNQL